jgi:hypothetical protein
LTLVEFWKLAMSSHLQLIKALIITILRLEVALVRTSKLLEDMILLVMTITVCRVRQQTTSVLIL